MLTNFYFKTRIMKKIMLLWVTIFLTINSFAQDYDSYCADALTLIAKKNYTEAIVLLNNAIVLHPERDTAYNNRGYAKMCLHEFNAAIEDYTKGISIHKNPYTYSFRGYCFSKVGDTVKAFLDFDSSLQMEPNFYLTLSKRGILYHYVDSVKLSINDIDRALAIDSSQADLYYFRAKDKNALGDYHGAIEDSWSAIALDSTNPGYYLTIGLSFQYLKDFNSAIQAYTVAISWDSTYALGYYCRGFCQLKLNHRELALDDFKKAADLGSLDGKEMLILFGKKIELTE